MLFFRSQLQDQLCSLLAVSIELTLTNLINFCSEMTGLVDKGRAVDIVYLDFSEAADIVSHNILIDKLLMHGLGK